MNFLICGFGNIGQRHCRSLRHLISNCEIDTYRFTDENRMVDNKLNIWYPDKSLKEIYKIRNEYFDLHEALKNKYDAVFICTPSSKHIEIALEVVVKGYDLFIEKPLSHNLEKINELENIIDLKNEFETEVLCVIGFQMRFHPLLQKVKKIIESGELGKIYRVEITHGSYVLNWMKDRSIEDFYALRSDLGGGVVLSQIHEIDYIGWLFNSIPIVKGVYGGKYLDIPSNVEDNVSILFDSNTKQNSPIILNLDFIQNPPKRVIKIFAEKKNIKADLISGSLHDGNIIDGSSYRKNWSDLFIDEMSCFIKSIKTRKIIEPLASLDDGIFSLETAMEIKEKLNEK